MFNWEYKKPSVSVDERKRLLEQWIDGKVDMRLDALEEAFGTEDFTSAIQNVAHLAMMEGMADVAPVWKTVSKIVPLNDLKARYLVKADGIGLLEKRIEHEPTTLAKPTDRSETYTPYVYDKATGLTMTAWANDETGVLQENFRTFGQAGVQTLNAFVLGGTTGLLGGTGVTMSDSVLLFDTATHANYGTNALNFESLQTGIAAMMNQTDEGGTQKAGYFPKYLLVDPAKQAVATQLCQSPALILHQTDTDDTAAARLTGSTNPWFNKMVPVVCPDLTATYWILAADPNAWPVVEMGFYQGKSEPVVEVLPSTSDATFFTRKMYAKCTLIFGGWPKSWKTLYKSYG